MSDSSITSPSTSQVSKADSNYQECLNFVLQLPRLSKDDLVSEDCPICLLPLDDYLSNAERICDETDEDEIDKTGVTRLDVCGHIFCRGDLVEWIMGSHGSCPLCRQVFLVLDTTSEPESSDGGEYTPSSDFEDADAEYAEDDDDDLDMHESEWEEEDSSWNSEEGVLDPPLAAIFTTAGSDSEDLTEQKDEDHLNTQPEPGNRPGLFLTAHQILQDRPEVYHISQPDISHGPRASMTGFPGSGAGPIAGAGVACLPSGPMDIDAPEMGHSALQ